MTHPIATYELDEDKLFDATITEVAEARAHLGDAEAVVATRLEQKRSEHPAEIARTAEQYVERAKSCLVVAVNRLMNDDIGLAKSLSEQRLHAGQLATEAIFACDAALAHVRIFESRDRSGLRDAGTGSHADKAIDAARRATHTLLADLLAART